MSARSKRRMWNIVGCCFIAAAVMMAAFTYGPMLVPAPTPTMSLPPVATSTPVQSPGASPSDSKPTSTPTATPTRPVLSDPVGKPESLTILRGSTQIMAPMAFRPRVVLSDKPGWFQSESGYVAYWDANEDSPSPGQLSVWRSLITGHVVGKGGWYPIGALVDPGVQKGDTLYIQYSSKDVVVAVADEASHDVPKGELNRMDEYTKNAQPARTIRLTTCDRTGAIRKDGHAANNSVVRFTVVDIIKH